MTLDEIKAEIASGLEGFRVDAKGLFEANAGERALVAHLLGHLKGRFGELSVDAEYDRHGSHPKYLPLYRMLLEEHGLRVAKREAPRAIDIVVHERGSDDHNLLAIEVKRTANRVDRMYDRLKLEALRRELGYRFTLLLELDPEGNAVTQEWHEQ